MQGFENQEVKWQGAVVVVEVVVVVVMVAVMVVVMVNGSTIGKVVAVILLFVRRIPASCAQAYSPALAMAAVLVVELVVVIGEKEEKEKHP